MSEPEMSARIPDSWESARSGRFDSEDARRRLASSDDRPLAVPEDDAVPLLRGDDGDQVVMKKGRLLTRREKFFLDRGFAALENSIPILNDSLGRMVTISSAFIGGGFILAKGEVVPFWAAAIAIFSMAICLIAATFALLPKIDRIQLSDPDDCERSERETIHRKYNVLIFVYLVLVFAIGIAFFGMLYKNMAPTLGFST